MKFANPGKTVRFVPDEIKPDIWYDLSVPLLYEKVAWEQAVAAHGGRSHSGFKLLAALRAGCAELIEEGDTRAETLAVIDTHVNRLWEYFQRLRANGFSTDTEDQRKEFAEATGAAYAAQETIDLLESRVGMRWAPFAEMTAENIVYPAIRGIEAARLFLAAWSRPEMLKWRPGGFPDVVLKLIPPLHFAPIGLCVLELCQPTEAEAKNSASPSPSASSPKDSAAIQIVH